MFRTLIKHGFLTSQSTRSRGAIYIIKVDIKFSTGLINFTWAWEQCLGFKLILLQYLKASHISDLCFWSRVTFNSTQAVFADITVRLSRLVFEKCFICAWQIAIQVTCCAKSRTEFQRWLAKVIDHVEAAYSHHRSLIGICYLFHSDTSFCSFFLY